MTDYSSEEFWKGAPEGATGYLPESGAWYAVWVKEAGNIFFTWLASGDTEWDEDDTFDEVLKFLIRRPITQPWTGDGLPPVGTVCDVTPHNTIWGFSVVDTYGCTVLAYHDDFVWVDIGTPGVPVATRIDKVDFAPIKTHAQIAAEERDAAIEEIEDMIAGFSYRKCAELVYDAGYRKGYDK